jgi:hypothetical protein
MTPEHVLRSNNQLQHVKSVYTVVDSIILSESNEKTGIRGFMLDEKTAIQTRHERVVPRSPVGL